MSQIPNSYIFSSKKPLEFKNNPAAFYKNQQISKTEKIYHISPSKNLIKEYERIPRFNPISTIYTPSFRNDFPVFLSAPYKISPTKITVKKFLNSSERKKNHNFTEILSSEKEKRENKEIEKLEKIESKIEKYLINFNKCQKFILLFLKKKEKNTENLSPEAIKVLQALEKIKDLDKKDGGSKPKLEEKGLQTDFQDNFHEENQKKYESFNSFKGMYLPSKNIENLRRTDESNSHVFEKTADFGKEKRISEKEKENEEEVLNIYQSYFKTKQKSQDFAEIKEEIKEELKEENKNQSSNINPMNLLETKSQLHKTASESITEKEPFPDIKTTNSNFFVENNNVKSEILLNSNSPKEDFKFSSPGNTNENWQKKVPTTNSVENNSNEQKNLNEKAEIKTIDKRSQKSEKNEKLDKKSQKSEKIEEINISQKSQKSQKNENNENINNLKNSKNNFEENKSKKSKEKSISIEKEYDDFKEFLNEKKLKNEEEIINLYNKESHKRVFSMPNDLQFMNYNDLEKKKDNFYQENNEKKQLNKNIIKNAENNVINEEKFKNDLELIMNQNNQKTNKISKERDYLIQKKREILEQIYHLDKEITTLKEFSPKNVEKTQSKSREKVLEKKYQRKEPIKKNLVENKPIQTKPNKNSFKTELINLITKNVEKQINLATNEIEQNRSLSLFDKATLLEQKKELISKIFEREIQKMEMQECTFIPKISKERPHFYSPKKNGNRSISPKLNTISSSKAKSFKSIYDQISQKIDEGSNSTKKQLFKNSNKKKSNFNNKYEKILSKQINKNKKDLNDKLKADNLQKDPFLDNEINEALESKTTKKGNSKLGEDNVRSASTPQIIYRALKSNNDKHKNDISNNTIKLKFDKENSPWSNG